MKTRIIIFGASNPSAQYLLSLVSTSSNFSVIPLLTRPSAEYAYRVVDMANPQDFVSCFLDSTTPTVLVSFCPIWVFAEFLSSCCSAFPASLSAVHRVIACSSSSSQTKLFSPHPPDSSLANRLLHAEQTLSDCLSLFPLSLDIIRPSLIYGNIGELNDHNLSVIFRLSRLVPFIPIPRPSGLRQPIHHSQLASCILMLSTKPPATHLVSTSTIHSIGGDIELSYEQMLRCVVASSGRPTFFLSMPSSIFYFLLSPLLLFFPGFYHALLRISANFSGFTRSSDFLDEGPKEFPVHFQKK